MVNSGYCFRSAAAAPRAAVYPPLVYLPPQTMATALDNAGREKLFMLTYKYRLQPRKYGISR